MTNKKAKKLLENNPTNEELIYLIEWTDLKQEAWERLLKQNPSNEDLVYIIRYTDLKKEAWDILLKQNPSNSELVYIIRHTGLKKEAAEQLLKQNPTNGELATVLKSVKDNNIRHEAARRLRQNIGVPENIDEEFEIKRIAQVVTTNPDCLNMSRWHCGTTHCIAGHLCILNEQASELEKEYETGIVAAAFLPSYVPMFYVSNETALKFLKSLV